MMHCDLCLINSCIYGVKWPDLKHLILLWAICYEQKVYAIQAAFITTKEVMFSLLSDYVFADFDQII